MEEKFVLRRGMMVKVIVNYKPQWALIEMVNAHNVFVIIPPEERAVMFKRSDVVVPTTARLCVSSYMIRQIKTGKKNFIMHPRTTLWNNIYKELPELIMLYTNDGYMKTYIIPEEAHLVMRCREYYIKLKVKEVLL